MIGWHSRVAMVTRYPAFKTNIQSYAVRKILTFVNLNFVCTLFKRLFKHLNEIPRSTMTQFKQILALYYVFNYKQSRFVNVQIHRL